MIRQALRHLPGIGPGRLNDLLQAGIRSWSDILDQPLPDTVRLSPRSWETIQSHVRACEQALQADDLTSLVQTLAKPDHWRILAHGFERASYFDIETTGLECDSQITLIVCHHRGRLHTFVKDENLDDFLELLEDVELLVSFNGASFDVPRILAHYHIPELPCAHLDLRWICYHVGLKGGLKLIEPRLGIRRPWDLQGVDGAQAVWLWNLWEHRRDPQAREKLLRYGRADVLALKLVAAYLLRHKGCPVDCPEPADLWQQLTLDDDAPPPDETERLPENIYEPENLPGMSPLQRRLQERWRQTRRRGM